MMSRVPHSLPQRHLTARGPTAVLHLLWDGQDVLAWAELRPVNLLGSGVKGSGVPPHPFAANATVMAELLRLPRRVLAAERRLPLHLPARPAGWPHADPSRLIPVASPGLGGDVEGFFPLHPFTVPAFPVLRSWLPTVLFGSPGRGMAVLETHSLGGLSPDLCLGGDARFVRSVGALALVVCARGGFAPGLASVRHGVVMAEWVSSADPRVREELARLAEGMPPSCRQVAPPSEDADLEALLGLCVDVVVRACLEVRRHALGRTLRASDPAERWLLSLLHSVPLALRPVRELEEQIRGWTAEGVEEPAPRVQLVLRLDDPLEVEPSADPGPGSSQPREDRPEVVASCPLTVLVQTLDVSGVPGSQVPLAELFGPRTPAGLARLRQPALEALRAAARVFAPLAALVRDPAQPFLGLSAEEALTFAGSPAQALASDGIEVLMPEWWSAAPAVPTACLRVGPIRTGAGRGALSLDSLAAFRWEVALGGETLSPEEFETLVRSRQPLVRLRSGWVRVDPGAMREMATQWEESGTSGQLPALAALRLALEAQGAGAATRTSPGAQSARAPLDLEVSGAVAAWLGRLGELRRLEPLPEPDGFTGSLRPYQRNGLGWLAFLADLGLGGCLADDMGLGKTVQILALLQHRRVQGQSAGPCLLVCPTSVLGNWMAELRRFTPGLTAHLHYGQGRPTGAALTHLASLADVVLTSYSLLVRDREDLAAVDWDGVILDEAQNIKTATALQAQAARDLRARWRFALTGTPVENRLQDLWSIFSFALPGYLGGARSFTRSYATPIHQGQAAVAERLRGTLAPFVLRRTKRDPAVAAELPTKTELRQDCPLTAEQASLYQATLRESLERISGTEGMVRRAAVLTTLLRLKQICDHPSLLLGDRGRLEGRSGKLDRLEELLDDVVAEGDRALVFTQFATWARRLQAHLAERLGCQVLCLDGSVPGGARAEMVRQFQEGEGPGVFVLSLRAGGTGLNLMAARHVFHYDRWWNPAVESQATDRAYRLGQTRGVLVHRLIAPGTLEERIDEILSGKAQIAAQVVGEGGEAWLTEMDTEQLRGILTLRAGASGE